MHQVGRYAHLVPSPCSEQGHLCQRYKTKIELMLPSEDPLPAHCPQKKTEDQELSGAKKKNLERLDIKKTNEELHWATFCC